MGRAFNSEELKAHNEKLAREELAKKRIYIPARNYSFAAGGVTHVGVDLYFTDRSKCESWMEQHGYGREYHIKEMRIGENA